MKISNWKMQMLFLMGVLILAEGVQAQHQPLFQWNAGSVVGIMANGHGVGVLSGTGTYFNHVGGVDVKGDVIADGKGGCIYSNVTNVTTTREYLEGDRLWKAGAVIGITDNGHRIGVLSGTGKFYKHVGRDKVTGAMTADGVGGCVYSNLKNITTTSEYWDGVRMWKAGAIVGTTDRGKGIGVISGTGKLHLSEAGARVTGEVMADENGGYVYSNITTGTTTSEYWDGVRMWKAGAILGITDKNKDISVLSGTGKLDYIASGAHVTGDVTADGKGGYVYSNVTTGTTTSEYWDGVRMWKAGAILGITDKNKDISVLSGTGKLD